MIDKWFKKDIEKVLKDKNIIVFIDESKEGSFLLNCVSDDIVRYEANDGIEKQIRCSYS